MSTGKKTYNWNRGVTPDKQDARDVFAQFRRDVEAGMKLAELSRIYGFPMCTIKTIIKSGLYKVAVVGKVVMPQ